MPLTKAQLKQILRSYKGNIPPLETVILGKALQLKPEHYDLLRIWGWYFVNENSALKITASRTWKEYWQGSKEWRV